MSALRRQLLVFAAVWLCCQLTIVASPVALDCFEPVQTEATTPAPAPDDCAMRGVCVPFDMALVSVSIGDGVLPSTLVVLDQPLMTLLSDSIAAPLTLAAWPDVPPPRF